MLKTNESVGLITTDTDLPTRSRNKQIGEIGLQIFGNTKVNLFYLKETRCPRSI